MTLSQFNTFLNVRYWLFIVTRKSNIFVSTRKQTFIEKSSTFIISWMLLLLLPPSQPLSNSLITILYLITAHVLVIITPHLYYLSYWLSHPVTTNDWKIFEWSIRYLILLFLCCFVVANDVMIMLSWMGIHTHYCETYMIHDTIINLPISTTTIRTTKHHRIDQG